MQVQESAQQPCGHLLALAQEVIMALQDHMASGPLNQRRFLSAADEFIGLGSSN